MPKKSSRTTQPRRHRLALICAMQVAERVGVPFKVRKVNCENTPYEMYSIDGALLKLATFIFYLDSGARITVHMKRVEYGRDCPKGWFASVVQFYRYPGEDAQLYRYTDINVRKRSWNPKSNALVQKERRPYFY